MSYTIVSGVNQKMKGAIMITSTILMVANTGAKTAQYIRSLEKHYRVVIARSGKQALVKFGENKINIVILDAVFDANNG